jgi:hypothetical protein
MRNVIAQSLPPGAEITLKITPPMTEDERHYLLKPPSHSPVVVTVIDDAHVSITNPGDTIAYFVFCVGPVMRLPPGMYEAISAYLTTRKNPS